MLDKLLKSSSLFKSIFIVFVCFWLVFVFGFGLDAASTNIQEKGEFSLEQVSQVKNFKMSEQPEIEFEFRKDRGFWGNLGAGIKGVFVDEYKHINVKSQIINNKLEKVNKDLINVEYQEDGKFKISLKDKLRQFKPGKYEIEVAIQDTKLTGGEVVNFTQDFTWGVLAINFNRSIYKIDEESYIQMAVLDEKGNTICDADLTLEIDAPGIGGVEILNTDDKKITRNPKCGPNNVIDSPDYYTYFRLKKLGKYNIKLIANTKNGVYEITDSIEVNPSTGSGRTAFEIERVGPTRIWPGADYPMTLKIKANEDFEGDIVDVVPLSFQLINPKLEILNSKQAQNTKYKIQNTVNEKQLIWQDVKLDKGDELEITYTFDAPNVSPEFYLLGALEMNDQFQELRSWQIASDAVGSGIAWMTATGTTFSADLNQSSAYALAWNNNDYDFNSFDFSDLNPSRLIVKEAGDYLMNLNLPLYRVDGTNNRARIEADVRVNGVKRDIGVGRSSYIRNAGGHSESSDHLNVLLEGLSVNDYVEIFVRGATTWRASMETYISGHAAMTLQKIEANEVIFTGTATQTVGSTNLNSTSDSLTWTESVKDTGYTHSDAVSPENITLDAIGNYLVFVNIPLSGSVSRGNVLGRVRLGGTQIAGGQFKQGYIRNADGDTTASIHWSGIVRTTAVNQILTITTEQEAAAGTITVGSDKASIYIQRLATTTDTYLGRGTELVGGTDWNPDTADSVLWQTDDFIDINTFTHSTTANAQNITVLKGGSYRVVYNDSLTAGSGRPNPVIQININGSPVSGAETKSHYIRGASGHNDSSASLVYLLRNVNANDVISITTVREGDTDTSNDNDDALLFLEWVDDAIPPTSNIDSISQKSDGSGAVDITVDVTDGNGDDLQLSVEYEEGAACAFSSVDYAAIDETDINTSATYGDPTVDTNYAYQVGTTSAMIITSGGVNTVNFDWLSASDVPNASSTYCVRILARDEGGAVETTYATSTVVLDNYPPQVTSIALSDLMYAVGDTLTATITVASDASVFLLDSSATINNATTTNLQKINNTTYTVDYVVAEGDSDRATGTIPYSMVLADQNGNTNTPFSGNFTNGSIDANSPNITSVSAPELMLGIGDTLTATITVAADTDVFQLKNTSTINGKTPINFQKINNTTYAFDYLVTEGDTNRASGTIPISIILIDGYGNENIAYTTFTSDASVDANRPSISAVYIANGDYGFGNDISLSIISDQSGYILGNTTVNDVVIDPGNLTDNLDNTYTLIYSVSEGDTDRTAGNIPISIILQDNYGNGNVAYITPETNTASVDANRPVILTISLPNLIYGIGDTVTATATVTADTNTYTLGTTTINNVTAGNLVKYDNSTYTFDIIVSEGDTDRAAGTIPISLMLKDQLGQYNNPASTTVETNTAVIDATKPPITGVIFIPSSGVLKVGDTATATVQTDGIGYSAGTVTINGVDVASTLIDNGDNTYDFVYTVGEGETDRGDADDLPVNITLIDTANNSSDPYTTVDPSGRPGVDANTPTISSVTIPNVTMKVGDTVTATTTVGDDGGETYTLVSGNINGFTLGSFTRINNTTYTAQFTVTEGGTDVPAGNDINMSLIITDAAGNESIDYNTPISQGSDPIDANTPTISSVTIPNITMKVGDTVTATTTVGDDGGETYTLVSGNINGFTLGSFTRIDNTTYTAEFTVTEGGTDVPAGNDINMSLIITDAAGNESVDYNTPISQGSDEIDANTPVIIDAEFLPISGVLKVGDIATATISVSGSETGLVAGATVTINSVNVSGSLTDIGGGDYTLVYTVAEGNNDVSDSSDMPVNIALADSAGNESVATTTVTYSKAPGIDANTPTISTVTFLPTSGFLGIGQTATATIASDEAGCSAGTMTINSVDVSGSLTSIGGGSYTVTYTVSGGDNAIADIADLPVNFVLIDAASNTSSSYTTADAGNRPGVDATNPTVPGNLSLNSKSNTSITLDFGATTTDTNFSEYKIFYKEGTSGVTESDSAWTQANDSDLSSATFNGTTNTTITGLSTSTSYVFNIYAYDSAGNKAQASEASYKTNSYPTAPGSINQLKNDGVTSINNEAWVDEMNLKFTASTTDIDAGENLSLYFELVGDGDSFTGNTASPCLPGSTYASCSNKVWEATSTNAAWYNTEWQYRKKITINASQILANETGFVVLATTTDTGLRDNAREDGFDILFTQSNGTSKLDYEREYFASTTGELIAWIETDISSTTDTVLYMYYGNASASTDNQNKSGVWDSNYEGVWHLNTDPSAAVLDSTTNGNDMAQNGGMDNSNQTTGYIGRALNFDGGGDFLGTSTITGYTTIGNYTMTAWFYNSSQSGWSNFYSHTTTGDYDPQFALNGADLVVYDGATISGGTLTADNKWHRVDFVRTGSTLNFYIDGAFFGTGTHSDTVSTPSEVYIGNSGSSQTEYWSGDMDEIRFSTTARSVNSIATEFNNQSSVGSFMSFEEEEDASPEFVVTIDISTIPESAAGYKWRVMACDDEDACTTWENFNATTPNFKIDLAAPTAPGAMTENSKTNTSVTLNFGATTTEANFSEYRIYYKIGTGEVKESDSLFDSNDDSNLGDILFNGASTTTVDSLIAGTTYSFAMWAYDEAGNKASSSAVTITTNSSDNPPTGLINSVAQKTDGSGVVDISMEIDDPDNDDDVMVKVEYVQGAACDFASPQDPSLDSLQANIYSDFGTPIIDNDQAYQVGSSTGWILTSPGSNTVNFDWDTQADIPAANGTYCLRITANDGSQDQTTPATTTIYVDNTNPTNPGALTVIKAQTNSVELQFGATSTESNFSEYKIYYKLGDSGVTESDNVWDSGDDVNLGNQLFNGQSTTTITGLNSGVGYVFKVYAYDIYGNKASSTEVTATTNYTPDDPATVSQHQADKSSIANGELINNADIILSATTTDVNNGETMSFYYELLPDSGTFTSPSTEPSSSCSSGTAYDSCTSKIWKVSTSTSQPALNWYNSSWIYRKKITINASEILANETDFPVLVNVTDGDLIGKVRSDGFDIVFTSSDGSTVLDYERERIDAQNGKLTAWVKTDISSTTNTVLYMYYGNGSATDTSTTTAIWDSNYKGVWHLSDDPTGSVLDSTINSNTMTINGTMDGDDSVDGPAGKAFEFDGNNDFLSNTSTNGYGTPGDYTVTAWFKYGGTSGYTTIYNHNTYDPQFGMNNNQIMIYDGADLNSSGSDTYTDNEWHRIDYRRSGNTLTFFVDGEIHGTVSHTATLPTATQALIAYSNFGSEYWGGSLDEVRYSETARSNTYLKTEFNNQSSPGTFMNFETEEVYKYFYHEEASITGIPDSNDGYKWQVIACDDDSACSDWVIFNASSPNFKVDAAAPTPPGALTLNNQTANTITINFGASTTESNFSEYKIFYKIGSSGVTEGDSLHGSSTEPGLGYIDYNNNSTTTITGLDPGTEYVFNIWAYDVFGRKASSTVELVASTNYPPTGSFNSVDFRTDGSGVMDISILVNDSNNDDSRAKLEYEAGASCAFGSPLDPSLDQTDENATSTQGDAKVLNSNEYQIGNSSGWIETSGVNTVNLDWLSQLDENNQEGDYCLRLTTNDQIDDQLIPATTTVYIDSLSPTTPGDLTLNSKTGTSFTLNFGATTTETNFTYYKIYYREGAGTVLETDTEHVDADLNDILFNGTATTTISGLLDNTQYSFNIFAYDAYGNVTSASQLTVTTNAPPTGSINSVAQKTDGSGVVDVSIEVYDVNGDDCTAKIEYVAGAACDFASPLDPQLDETQANIYSEYGVVGINNAQEYQIGTSTGKIITTSGSNTVNFDWDTKSTPGMGAADGVYCVRITANDGFDDQSVLATTTVVVDNVAPTDPGALSDIEVTGISVTAGFGATTTDSNFKEYKIFYKEGASGVTESDIEYNKYDDTNLGNILFNNATNTLISGLQGSTQYAFNIWAYDIYGNKSSSTIEMSTTTDFILTATWRETEDNPIPTAGDYLGRGETVRLRLAIANTGDWTATGSIYRIEYGVRDTTCEDISAWTTVPVSATTEHFQMVNSLYFNNWDLTTAKLSGGSYSFTPGNMIKTTSTSTPITLAGGEYSEIEYTFSANANAVSGNVYCFRATDQGAVLDNYDVYPEATIAPPPTGVFNSAYQKTDGSHLVDISVEIEDLGKEENRAKLEFATGTTCNFSSPGDPTIDTTDENVTADFGDPEIDNGNEYQIGTTSGMIITQYGSNTVDFDWLANTDFSGADDTYCLRFTTNDGYETQIVSATTTIVIDQVDPTTPGNPGLVGKTSNSVTINFATSSDTNFKEYRVYYKEGSGGVTESDQMWASSSDPNLGYMDMNGATSTTVTGLEINKQYTFKVWAYDQFGNKSSSAGEITVFIRYKAESENWRFYSDQQNETPLDSLGDENTAPSDIVDSATIKLRLALREQENITGDNIKMRLQYSTFSDFSADVHFVGEIGSTTPYWTYGDGVDNDDDSVTTALLSGVSIGASHNESGISTSSFSHAAGTVVEWEFTINDNDAPEFSTFYFRAYDVVGDEPVTVADGYSYPSAITSGGSLSYTVSGFNTGSSTEGITANITSSATNMPFGTLLTGNEAIGVHRFEISTNANGGYQLLTVQKQNFVSNNGADIDPVLANNESPAGWPAAPSTSAYGYHTGDDTLSGGSPSRFLPDNTYARFEENMKEVSYSQIPVDNEVVDLVYRVEIGELQEAGDYEMEIVYILVPTFYE